MKYAAQNAHGPAHGSSLVANDRTVRVTSTGNGQVALLGNEDCDVLRHDREYAGDGSLRRREPARWRIPDMLTWAERANVLYGF